MGFMDAERREPVADREAVREPASPGGDDGRPWRRRLSHAALCLLVAWFALGTALESHRLVRRQVLEPPRWAAPRLWRYGGPSHRRLERFLTHARRVLPPRGTIAFASKDSGPRDAFFRAIWAAHLLPEHDVIPSFYPQAGERASHWIAYGTRLDDPRLEPLLESWAGAVYRVVPP